LNSRCPTIASPKIVTIVRPRKTVAIPLSRSQRKGQLWLSPITMK
jgi:hypothetical protein